MVGKNDVEDFILDNKLTLSSFAFGCVFIFGLMILVACETIKEFKDAIH